MLYGLPVFQEIVVPARQHVSGLANRTKEAIVVTGRQVDDLPVSGNRPLLVRAIGVDRTDVDGTPITAVWHRPAEPREQDADRVEPLVPLVDLLIDTRAELMELAIASGLKVLTTMLEADRTALCGPRYQHQAERAASRAGRVSGEVVLGGRKVQIRRPRVRAGGHEVALGSQLSAVSLRRSGESPGHVWSGESPGMFER
jgi:hypothetical protein